MKSISEFDYIFYQNQILPIDVACLKNLNRGILYGDGFFETIRCDNGSLAHLDLHYIRIQKACSVLKLEFIGFWDKILDDLHLASNFYTGFERVLLRLQIIRSGAGLYLPEQNGVDWFITCRPAHANPSNAGIILEMQPAQTIHTQYSRFSEFKSTSESVIYVLAALERQERQLDALLLTNNDGQISEACSGNIFWLDEQNTLCTPALNTGCINGIRRQIIMAKAIFLGVKCMEVNAQINQLQNAKAIFVTNINAVKPVAKFDNWAYDITFCKLLVEKLLL